MNEPASRPGFPATDWKRVAQADDPGAQAARAAIDDEIRDPFTAPAN
jgi:hypothetical protein